MDVLNHYSDLLTLFLSLVVAGTAVRLALQEPNHKTYQWGDKEISKQKVHTGVLLIVLGLVIQLVANSVESLSGKQLILDEKVLAAYAFALMVMVMKK